MIRMLILVFCAIVTLSPAYEGLYGVIAGGNVREYAPEQSVDASRIVLSNGISFDVRSGEPSLDRSLTRAESRYYIVHCSGPIYPADRARLEGAGVAIYFYLPNNAFVVRMSEPVKNEVARFGFVD